MIHQEEKQPKTRGRPNPVGGSRAGAVVAKAGRPRSWQVDVIAAGSALFLLLLSGAAICAPLLMAGDVSRVDLSRPLLPPHALHPLGTDSLGRDVFGMAVYGARVSLSVGVSAAAASALLGMALGLGAAELGGTADVVLCRLVDAALAVPAFFVLIAFQALVGPGVVNVVIVVSLVNWMATARVVRAVALSLKEREFIVAARALGCSSARVTFRHVLPNIAPIVSVLFALGVADALLMESALSFLGLGVPLSEPSWGNMLNGAQAGILAGAWWVAAVPGGLILLSALSINLLGDRASIPRAGPVSPR